MRYEILCKLELSGGSFVTVDWANTEEDAKKVAKRWYKKGEVRITDTEKKKKKPRREEYYEEDY